MVARAPSPRRGIILCFFCAGPFTPSRFPPRLQKFYLEGFVRDLSILADARGRRSPAEPADADLAGCGLSRQKRGYLVDLAKHFQDNRIPNRRLRSMSDEEIIEALTAVKGIGRWTAEMFLMFVLNRTDVLPVDDLGLQNMMMRAAEPGQRSKAAKMKKIAEPSRLYRTIASWYLWRVSIWVMMDGLEPRRDHRAISIRRSSTRYPKTVSSLNSALARRMLMTWAAAWALRAW